MALIKRGNESPYVYWWTDAVNFSAGPRRGLRQNPA